MPKPALHRLSYEVCQIEAFGSLFVCIQRITCIYSNSEVVTHSYKHYGLE